MTTGTALVTGGSAGIGRALAEEFARHGHDVVLAARREERLRAATSEIEDAHGVDADHVAVDLADRAGREALVDAVDDRPIDYLVNNVGIGTHGPFLETDLEREFDELELNVVAPTHLTKRFAPAMRDRDAGGILNVASSAAFQPGPFMAVYYASKSYLFSFSRALHEELSGTDVAVTALCPGFVETEFQDRAGIERARVGSPTPFPRWLSPDRVARTGYEGLMDGDAVAIPGLEYKLLWRVVRFTPDPVVRKLAAMVNRPTPP